MITDVQRKLVPRRETQFHYWLRTIGLPALALLFAVLVAGPTSVASAASGGQTLLVTNGLDVKAYPANSGGDLPPLALTTDMITPRGLARDSSGRLYVTNVATSTITIYPADATGNVAPLAVIGGAATELDGPGAIAVDTAGKIYVLNVRGGENQILVYPPLGAATGVLNEPPSSAISGSATQFAAPVAMALDEAGNLYVANTGTPGSITIYAAGATGDAAPKAIIAGAATGMHDPVGLAVDSHGAIYVANAVTYKSAYRPYPGSILIFPPGSTGNVAPEVTITGANTTLDYPQGLAVDSSGNIYVSSASGSDVSVFAAGSAGNAAPILTLTSATGPLFPYALVLDSAGNLYVLNTVGGPTEKGAIMVYPPGSTGSTPPTTTISSSFNGIENADSIVADSLGNIYVGNFTGGADQHGSVTVYSAASYAAGPPIATLAGAATGLSNPLALAVDSTGRLVVLNSNNTVTEYSSGSAGNVAPAATLDLDTRKGESPSGIAVDSAGDLVVVNQSGPACSSESAVIGYKHDCRKGSLAIYASDAEGAAAPRQVITDGVAEPGAVATSTDGSIYVAIQSSIDCPWGFCSSYGPSSIRVYGMGRKGTFALRATIRGKKTGLRLPYYSYGIALDSSGNIYAPGIDPWGYTGEILIFPPGSTGDVAPTLRIGGSLTSFFSYGSVALALAPAIAP